MSPFPKQCKTDTTVSAEKIASYTVRSYSEALWVTTRYLQHVLPKPATSVLLFIINRTMRYHKASDDVALSQFVNGVFSGHTLQTSSCGYGKSTVARAVSLLSEMGIIERSRTTNSERGNTPTRYTIHYKSLFKLARVIVHQSHEERLMSRINLAKRFKEIKELGTPPCLPGRQALSPEDTTLVSQGDTHSQVKHSQVKHSQKNQKPTATSGRRIVRESLQSIAKQDDAILSTKDRVKKLVSTVVGSSKASRAACVEDARAAGKLTVKAANAMWQQAMAQYYPGAPYAVFTLKSFGILKKATATHHVKDLNAFIDWVVDNWSHNRTHSLHWYKDGGAKLSQMPDIEQFARLYKHFVKLYAEHQVGAHHKVNEVEELKARVTLAERKVQQAQDEAARLIRDAERSVHMKDAQIEAARRDAARAINNMKSQVPRKETRTMEEVRDELMGDDDFSSDLPEWN